MKLFNGKGQAIKADKLLGRGAKGDVYGAEGKPDLAIKLYREPLPPRMVARLKLMVEIGNPRLMKIAAWPIDTLHDDIGGRALGFLMPNFAASKQIHQLFGVKSRLAYFQHASWPFLLHAAANVARAFHIIHEHGHIIGDVSSTNVMVSTNAVAALIDCDNFQIAAQNEQFLCDGGTTGYVPSELIGGDFSKIQRTRDHDSFGLAVLIFQLLFMGRHPFSGTFQGGGEKDLDQFVKERRFAYGAGAERRQMAPPPGTLPLEAVPASISALFERAFLSDQRPAPHEWVEALDGLAKSLKRCDYHNAHYYLKTLPACCWCTLERASGVRLFNFVFSESAQSKVTFNLDDAWRKIMAVQPPGPDPALAGKNDLAIKPSAEAMEIDARRKRKKLLSIGVAALSTTALFFSGLPVWAVGGSLAALLLVGNLIAGNKLWATGKTASAADSSDPLIQSLRAKMQDAERIAAHYEQRWRDEAGEGRYHNKLEELKAKKAEYVSLPAIEQRKLAELRKVSKERQLDRFLDHYRTADARIDGIGPDHKITLQAYGFETAADIKRDSLMRVQGFSGTLGHRLIGWRKSIEEKFVFNPAQSITPADKYAVDQEMHSLRLKLEQELANGATHLRHTAQEVHAARETLRDKVEETRRALGQAQEDLRAATRTNPSRVVLLSMAVTLAILLLFQYLLKPFLFVQH